MRQNGSPHTEARTFDTRNRIAIEDLCNWLRLVPVAVAAIAIFLSQGVQAQQVYRVDGTNGNDNNDGFPDWSDSFATLQRALDGDLEEDDQIWVAEGTYVPSAGIGAARTFLIPNGVEILGGFPEGGGDGTEDARDPYTYITTLSGDLGSGAHAYHVVTVANIASAVTRLDGFVITGGDAVDDNDKNTDFTEVGGGMLIVQSLGGQTTSISVVRCRFVNNNGVLGGAVGATRHGNPQGQLIAAHFINCEFIENSTDGNGGAIFIQENVTATITNSLFVGNSADGDGAAISKTNARIINCEFRGNRAPTADELPVPRR